MWDDPGRQRLSDLWGRGCGGGLQNTKPEHPKSRPMTHFNAHAGLNAAATENAEPPSLDPTHLPALHCKLSLDRQAG